jgi:hypothetical protein
MEQSPSWAAIKSSASQEIPRVLWNTESITMFKSARHLSLSEARSIQFMPTHPTSLRSILILYSHLRQGLQSLLFLSGLPTKTLYAPLVFPIRTTFPAHLTLLDFITRIVFCEEYSP